MTYDRELAGGGTCGHPFSHAMVGSWLTIGLSRSFKSATSSSTISGAYVQLVASSNLRSSLPNLMRSQRTHGDAMGDYAE